MHVNGLFTGSGLVWESIVNWYHDSVFYELLAYLSERYFSVSFHIYEHIPLGPSANGTARMIIVAVMLGLILSSIVMAITKKRYGRFVKKLLKQECLSPEKSKTLTELEEFRNSSVRRAFFRGHALTKCVYCVRTSEALEVSAEESAEEDVAPENVEGVDGAPAEEIGKQVAAMTPDSGEAEAVASETADAENAEAEEEKVPEMSEIRASDRVMSGERLDYTVARFYIPEDLKYRAEIRYESRGSGWIPVVLTAVLSIVGAALICWLLPDFVQLLDNLISMTAPQ